MKKNRPLKVLIPVHVFFPEHFYGTETYTLELAKQLICKGYEPYVLTSTPFGEEGTGEELSRYEYQGVPVYRMDLNLKPHKRIKDTYYRSDLHALLRKIVSEIEPDIAHVTHLINHTSAILEVLNEFKVPTVATLTDFFGFCFNNKLEKYDGSLCVGPNSRSTNCLACFFHAVNPGRLPRIMAMAIKNKKLIRPAAEFFFLLSRVPGFRKGRMAGLVSDMAARTRILRYLYGVYRKMVAPTDFLYDAYVDNRFYPKRLVKINFGIDLGAVSEFARPKKKNEGEGIRFGYVGQIARHKGVDLLVEAFCKLRGSTGRFLSVYGPFDQVPDYMRELRELSKGFENVEFLGTFDKGELGRRLSELDLLVIPSRWYENSPLVLLYSLAVKTPVIVTDVKGLSEFVTDDFNGFTFQKDSVEDLRRIMQKIIDDPSLVARLSENATYEKDVSDHADEVLKIYESVLSE